CLERAAMRIAAADGTLSGYADRERSKRCLKWIPQKQCSCSISCSSSLPTTATGRAGCYDDGNGGHCLVGALLHVGRKQPLPTAPAIALLPDAMPRPGLPLVHFNDSRCGSAAELRSVILKARRLAHDDTERERAAATVKTWLLAQIEKKRAAP